tara:strand:- start:738 stop:1046 length:309 start_codon:yes stop_codon:yes gene_type:complete
MDKGLIDEPRIVFKACTDKRRKIIKIICLEIIVGFSFLETNIKIAQLTSTSVKVKNHEKILDRFKGEESSNLYDEIIDIKIHNKKIMRLSIFEILIGFFIGT